LAARARDVVDHLPGGRRGPARAVELGSAVVDDDLGALAGELERVGAADGASRAGDDGDAPLADAGHGGMMAHDLTPRQKRAGPAAVAANRASDRTDLPDGPTDRA